MRVFAVLLILPLLAGCSTGTWDYLTSFGGSDEAEASEAPAIPQTVAQATPPTPAPGAQTAGTPNAFCMAVAKQDASGNGFDAATQQRVALRNYRQCVEIFGTTVE